MTGCGKRGVERSEPLRSMVAICRKAEASPLWLTLLGRGAPPWLVGGFACILMFAAVSFNVAAQDEASAAGQCESGLRIDFAGVPAGTVLGEQYASLGVHISAVANGDFPDAAIVFDSNGSGSHDPDLEVAAGNIAILAKDLKDENGDGLVDDPDENNYGGKQIYTFDQPVHIGAFLFIDKDHGTPDRAIAYGPSDNVIKQVPILLAGNASVQTINVDADNVGRLEIVYRDSGGLTGIQVECPPAPSQTPGPSPIPSRAPTVAPTPTPPPRAASSVSATPMPPRPTAVALAAVALPQTSGGSGGSSRLAGAILTVGGLVLLAGTALGIALRRRQRRR